MSGLDGSQDCSRDLGDEDRCQSSVEVRDAIVGNMTAGSSISTHMPAIAKTSTHLRPAALQLIYWQVHLDPLEDHAKDTRPVAVAC